MLAAYRDWNLASFNYGLAGGGPRGREDGYQVVFKVLSRSNPEPVYRSDATYFERLYGEALIDLSPEEVRPRCAPGSELFHCTALPGQLGLASSSGCGPVKAPAAVALPRSWYSSQAVA